MGKVFNLEDDFCRILSHFPLHCGTLTLLVFTRCPDEGCRLVPRLYVCCSWLQASTTKGRPWSW